MTDNRAQIIADIRRLADYLEAHPELPVGRWDSCQLQHSIAEHEGYDKHDHTAMAEAVREAAKAMGVDLDVHTGKGGDVYHVARVRFGRAEYQVVAIIEPEGTETS